MTTFLQWAIFVLGVLIFGALAIWNYWTATKR